VSQVLVRPVSATDSNSQSGARLKRSGRALAPWLAAGLMVVALVFRFHGLDRESLWLDEGYTLYFSHLSLPRLILIGGAHEHPPLYYALVHAILRVRDWYLVPRIISALAGTLSVPALYALTARLYGRLAGLTAALLLAVAPFHLWYSQDGRAYELAGLVVLLSYLTLFAALDTTGFRRWVLYVACTVCCLYTDYTTVLALLPQVLLLAKARSDGRTGRLLIAWLACALLFAPWAGVLALDTATIAKQYWIPAPTWNSLVNTVLQFIGMRTPCPSLPCHGPPVPIPFLAGHEGVIAAVVIAAVLTALAVALLRRKLTASVLLLWLVGPFAIVLLLGLKRPLYLDRVFLDATFPLYIMLGAAVTVTWRRTGVRALAAVPAAIVLFGSIAGSYTVAATTTNPDWRSLARDLGAAYRPGQAVVFVPGVVRSLVGAYLPPHWHATRERLLWYHAYLDIAGWTHRYAAWSDMQLRDMQLRKVTAGEKQVWLVTMDYTDTAATREWMLDHGYNLLLSELYSGDTRLELWDRGRPKDLGPTVVPPDFDRAWTRRGRVSLTGGVLRERGKASTSRSFPVTSGAAYSVNVEWRSNPPAYPLVAVQTYDRAGHIVGTRRDRFGDLETAFPRTQWYSLPATGVWLLQPFGFVAPPGAVRATIRIENLWGDTSWRNIAVYRER
jgi:mannosyltransferase